MKTRYFVIDLARCQGCNNCFMACKDEYVGNDWPGYSAAQPLHGQRWIDIARIERGQFPIVQVSYRPMPCMHCDAAPCVKASDGAIRKRADGLVLIDPKKAKGKRELVEACPYHAIWWNEEQQLPQKCTGCAHLLDDQWKEPRCVQVCSTGALVMRQLEDCELAKLVAEEGLKALHPEYGTKPRVYYKNLHRFDRCFIAGTVADGANGVEECVSGARATVRQGETKVGEAVTDSYGEFRVDHLEPASGPYTVDIDSKHGSRTIPVGQLETSLYLGVIRF